MTSKKQHLESLQEPDRSIRLAFLKTRKEQFNLLPEPFKSQAFENLDSNADLEEDVESMAEAIAGGFDYEQSPEGFDYWYKVITVADEEYQKALPVPEWLNKAFYTYE